MSGTVAGEMVDDDLATTSMTYELADEPGVEHVFDGSVVANVTSNGCVILQGTLDADPLDENVDLVEVSYRADGSTASPDRRLADPPGVVDGKTIGDESRGWITIIGVTIVLVFGAWLVGIAYYGYVSGKAAAQMQADYRWHQLNP